MDFKSLFIGLIASMLIVVRRFILLVLTPYKTLRKISLENDCSQIFIILFFVFFYFQLASSLRKTVISPNVIFVIFLINFFLTNLFFYFLAKLSNKEIKFKSFIFTFSYSLFPTLLWFITNSFVYYFLPPPRTLSILGKLFTFVFIAFSISLLAWKLILFYLSLRFSTKLGFYRILYLALLYLSIFIPYSILLYQLKIFRIPFI